MPFMSKIMLSYIIGTCAFLGKSVTLTSGFHQYLSCNVIRFSMTYKVYTMLAIDYQTHILAIDLMKPLDIVVERTLCQVSLSHVSFVRCYLSVLLCYNGTGIFYYKIGEP